MPYAIDPAALKHADDPTYTFAVHATVRQPRRSAMPTRNLDWDSANRTARSYVASGNYVEVHITLDTFG